MSVPESDLELLETYLDGELADREVDALIGRLQVEQPLRSALETLRADRTVRAQMWQSFEPNDERVEKVVEQVQRKIDNHWLWTRRFSRLRPLVAAAACIIIGFGIGWTERGMHGSPTPPIVGKVATGTNAQAGIGGFPSGGGPVDIPLVDEYARPVAVQHFESAEEARRFLNEVRQWNDKTEQIHTGNAALVNDEQKF